jgi:hypothetical protein
LLGSGIEVYCPDCGKLFKSEKEMLEHYNTEHMPKVKVYPDVEIQAKYMGGHSGFTNQSEGYLRLYLEPHNRVVFTSHEFLFRIPVNKIKSTKVATEKELSALRIFLVGLIAFGWKKERKMFLISFEDELGDIQSAVFEHSDNIDYFARELYNLRVRMKNK